MAILTNICEQIMQQPYIYLPGNTNLFTCENFRQKYDLFTFSVGQGPFRRTVICFKSQLIDPQKYTDTAAAANFETRNRHSNSQIKNWRTDKRHSEPLHFSNNNSINSSAAPNSIKRNRKMGVEKNLIDAKLNKSNSLDLYRPPALRNHGNDGMASTKRTVCNVTDAFEDHPTATLPASSITATATTTSISCNNSPIHRKESASTTVNTDTTTSAHQNSLHSSQQQSLQQQEVDDEQLKQPQRQQQARRERRPDRAVYIPRARRSQTTPPTTTTTQIQQPPPPSSIAAQVSAPTANGTTATATTTTTANYTSKSLSQQLAITPDDTTAASVSEKPSSKADEVGKANCISNNTTTNHTTKKRDKLSKETRERREQRASKKSLSTQLNHNSKNNAKSNENTIKINDDEFSTHTVNLVIAQQTPPPVPVPQSSPTDVNSINCVEKLNPKVFDCDREREERILNKFDSSEVNHHESCVITNYLNFDRNDNCGVNEFETQLFREPIVTVSNNSTNTSNTVNISDIITMPKSSNKTKSNKISSAMDNAKMPNLRIEDVASQPTKCDVEEQELQRASKEINRSNRRIMKQTFISDILQIPDHIVEDDGELISTTATTAKKATPATQHTFDSNTEEEDEEDDWETMYDESGECLDPKIMQELTASVGKCKIELPKMDYSAFLTKQSILNEEEFPHVLEVSNFPVEFKNQDLLMVFSQYKESGFDIKWVDDTHALAVFSSSRIAAEVLTMGHPFVVLKPLAEATLESRLKAKKCAASLQPYRPRPETCAALARRLVTGALGVRLKTAAAERENEKRVLREAKERKLLAAKQRDEAWES